MPEDASDRRGFLVRVISVLLAFVSAPIAIVVGGVVLSPSLTRRRELWVPAAPLSDLDEGVLKTVHVQAARQDGYLRTVDREVVFLTRTGDSEVTALSSICTHLGCRVAWDAQARLLRCPCHGGAFTATGEVHAGPPPRPLTRLPTRLVDGSVLIQI